MSAMRTGSRRRAEPTLVDALRAARENCGADCFSYHAAWRLFRYTGLKGSPSWHVGFYRRALGDLIVAQGPVRVLVCAASDENMAAVLTELFGVDRLSIHMIDACATPLSLARDYASRIGLRLSTHRVRAPALASVSGPFDLIITDGLLSLLPLAEDRQQLLVRAQALLAPTGRLVYTTRIAAGHAPLEFDRLGRLARCLVARWAWPGPATQRRALASQAREQVSRPNPVTSLDELRELIRPYFADVRLFVRTSPPSLPLRLSAATRGGHISASVGVIASGQSRDGQE